MEIVILPREHVVVVRELVSGLGGSRFESLSTPHSWATIKSFIPSLVVWS